MENLGILNTDRIILVVKFQWKITNGKFLCHPDQLPKIIKEKSEGKPIEYIKEFDPVKLKFKRISKKQILAFCSWDTEGIQILKKNPYFK